MEIKAGKTILKELNNMEEIVDYIFVEGVFEIVRNVERYHSESGTHYVIIAMNGCLQSCPEKIAKEQNPTAIIIYNTRTKIIAEWYIIESERQIHEKYIS